MNKLIKIQELLTDESEKRADSVEKLAGFLLNQGRFSVLLLGMRGTGKTYWLENIQKLYQEEDCLNKIITVNAMIAKNSDEKFWEKNFEQANNSLLVVEDVEKLSKESQEILFEGLSTGEGGKYGFEEKKYELRIVFTSTFDIKTLRNTEEYLTHKFFHRISQLVTEIPSFEITQRNIWKDFEATWKKMQFQTDSKLPQNELKTWLETDAEKLHGNFRDLDKIAINWHHYRFIGKDEKDILELVKDDFNNFYRFSEHKSEGSNVFYIQEGLWKDNEQNFKKTYKEWLINRYGSLKKGAEKAGIGISYRTMERW